MTDEYDAFDYVNGDFDKVDEGRPGLPRPGVVEQHSSKISPSLLLPSTIDNRFEIAIFYFCNIVMKYFFY